MKLLNCAFLSVLLAFSCLKAQLDRRPSGRSIWDRRGAQLSFENVDFTLLQEQARRHKPTLACEDLEKLVQSNFQFIFFNKLNTANFLFTPKPQIVVKKIVSILRLNEQLRELVQEGRELVAKKGSDHEKRQLVRHTGNLAKELRNTFQQYFLDIRESSYTLNVRAFETNYGQFIHYIALSQRLNRLLTEEVEHYFLNPTPGVIEISEYGDVSITVLSECLQRVSTFTEERLRR